MRRTNRYRWNESNDPGKMNEGVPNASVFDFTALPLCLVEVIPVRYLDAVMRACRDRPSQTCDGGGWEEASVRFRLYVEEEVDQGGSSTGAAKSIA